MMPENGTRVAIDMILRIYFYKNVCSASFVRGNINNGLGDT